MAITKNSQIDLNGNEMILDADGDTTITADTDDQIDFKTAGTDRFIIDASGNIGFNTTGIAAGSTSSSQNSTATPKKIVINNDYSSGYTDASLKLYLFNSGTTRQGFTSGPAYDLQYHSSGHATGRHAFYVGNTEEVRIDADGIKFNGDSAAANALDDYEEGEHNPTITAGSGTPSIASVEDTLSYTKIGNKVFINGQLGGCNASGCSGTLSLTMPFACAAQSERADFYFGTASSNNNDVVMFVLTNTANTNVFTIAVVEQDGTKNTSSAAFMSTKSPFDMNFTGFHYTTT